MSQAIRDLVDTATAGRPVYISSVRERFAALPPSESFLLTASLDGFDEEGPVFTFRLPKFLPLADDERAMATEYVLAGLYNIISTLGGRGLSLSTDGDDGEGAALAAAVERAFGLDEPRLVRPGYGRAVNVSERMDEAISAPGTPSRGRFRVLDHAPSRSVRKARPSTGIEGLCALATSDMAGTAICGMDIGGTDIKLCLAVGGRVAQLPGVRLVSGCLHADRPDHRPDPAARPPDAAGGGAGHRRRRHRRPRRGARPRVRPRGFAADHRGLGARG